MFVQSCFLSFPAGLSGHASDREHVCHPARENLLINHLTFCCCQICWRLNAAHRCSPFCLSGCCLSLLSFSNKQKHRFAIAQRPCDRCVVRLVTDDNLLVYPQQACWSVIDLLLMIVVGITLFCHTTLFVRHHKSGWLFMCCFLVDWCACSHQLTTDAIV